MCPISFSLIFFRLGSVSIVKLLVENGADIELENVIGATPLIVAASKGIGFFYFGRLSSSLEAIYWLRMKYLITKNVLQVLRRLFGF